MNTKFCNKCNVEKDINEFSFRNDTKKFRNSCKGCDNQRKNQLKKQKFENYEWIIQLKELECGNCKIVKTIDCFSRRRDTELGVSKTCRLCKNYYHKNKRNTDPNFKLAHRTRIRINNALNVKSKSFHSKELLGTDIETYKRWIENQMSPEMNWNNIHIDHVRSISSFDVSKEDELLKAFNWINTRPLLKEDNLRKGSKYNELDYQLQFIKAYEFLKLNGETTTN